MANRIPVRELKIAEGWHVGDLHTVEDCEEAIIHLTREIAHIDTQLMAAPAEVPGVSPPKWVQQSETARSVKASIRELARRRQGELNRLARIALNDNARQKLINEFRSRFPVEFEQVLRETRRRQTA